MKIVADENIPCVEQAFSTLGDVTLVSGRELQAGQVRAADVLLVRSVTRVGAELLEGSRVRFVGSATIGFDHVDLDYLETNNIGFSTAPGSNAISAAEYVVSALLALSERQQFELAHKTIGIIGYGNVGSRVRRMLGALGVECLVNDPPLQEQGGVQEFVGLDEILGTDIITLHVPLTHTGRYPTFHLVDEAFMKRLRPHTILVNTARGAAVDNRALERLLEGRPDLSVVLDVWEGEPAIDIALLQKVALGTPHIAGYSLDGKMRGTEMVYRAVCAHFGLAGPWQAADNLPAGQSLDLAATTDTDPDACLRRVVFNSYDIRHDDRRLRELLSLEPAERAGYFDRLRKEYPLRREFSETTLRLGRPQATLRPVFEGLGFKVLSGD
ncbi:MAG: 4-phosphoerythronate dehydrogenase PdxB [Halobacteria archaeon]|nr:4-phosphoerythronate dehydrogenase PdxB [Halobacteria archaeon]